MWFERIQGGDEGWCICDEGICRAPDGTPVTLLPGTYNESFTWDGRNWTGPSDTGNPKGDPFPAGTYELTLRAEGTRLLEGGGEEPFEITATWQIDLVE